jgi:hypothetical protein
MQKLDLKLDNQLCDKVDFAATTAKTATLQLARPLRCPNLVKGPAREPIRQLLEANSIS